MLPYLYQYIVGGAVFGLGVVLAWRTGEIGLDSPRNRRRLAVLLSGLAFFAALQGVLQWSASL